jgi:hypothetical protein
MCAHETQTACSLCLQALASSMSGSCELALQFCERALHRIVLGGARFAQKPPFWGESWVSDADAPQNTVPGVLLRVSGREIAMSLCCARSPGAPAEVPEKFPV